jgi:hypothetical protein
MKPAVVSNKSVSNRSLWIGRIISVFAALFLLADSAMKLMRVAPVREAQARLGYPESATVWIGATLLICTILYVIPRTSILGAILLTGYLGGAVATQVRVGEPFYFTLVFGVVVWAGL